MSSTTNTFTFRVSSPGGRTYSSQAASVFERRSQPDLDSRINNAYDNSRIHQTYSVLYHASSRSVVTIAGTIVTDPPRRVDSLLNPHSPSTTTSFQRGVLGEISVGQSSLPSSKAMSSSTDSLPTMHSSSSGSSRPPNNSSSICHPDAPGPNLSSFLMLEDQTKPNPRPPPSNGKLQKRRSASITQSLSSVFIPQCSPHPFALTLINFLSMLFLPL